MLAHAEPPVYGEIATRLADRMAQVTPTMGAAERQELLVEERQLVDHLKRRYEGIPELIDALEVLEADLETFEATVTEVGPSPDPRDRSASGPERPNGQ